MTTTPSLGTGAGRIHWLVFLGGNGGPRGGRPVPALGRQYGLSVTDGTECRKAQRVALAFTIQHSGASMVFVSAQIASENERNRAGSFPKAVESLGFSSSDQAESLCQPKDKRHGSKGSFGPCHHEDEFQDHENAKGGKVAVRAALAQQMWLSCFLSFGFS
jgi:hypothetical protein